MTVVNLSGLDTALGAPEPVAAGSVKVQYWAGHRPYVGVAGEDITFPATITLPIVDGETTAPLDLVPTGGVCCVKWEVRSNTGGSLTRYTSIPASGPVDFGDLPIVDPASFTPIDVTPSLTEYILQLIGENPIDEGALEVAIEAYLTENPPAAATDATTVAKGIVQLAGDLGGTAAAPTVPGLAGKSNVGHSHAQADVTGLVTALAGKAATAHTHAEADVTGLTAALSAKLDAAAAPELIRDTIGTALVAGTNVTITPNDGSDTITISATGGGSTDPEVVRDTIAAALTAGNGITVTPNDGSDIITVAAGGVLARGVIVTTGSEARPAGGDLVIWVDPDNLGAPNKIATDFHWTPGGDSNKLDVSAAPELIRDTMGTALVAGSNVTITPNDVGDTITIAATGGGGGSVIGATGVIKIKSGNWFGAFDTGGTGAFASGSLNRLDLAPVYISQSTSVNRIAIRVATGGGAGAVTRLGIFNAKSDGMPGTVLLDAGTVDCTTGGMKEITITQTLAPGLYYLGAVNQVATSALYAHKGMDRNRYGSDWDEGFFASEAANMMNFLSVTGVTGALGDLSSATFTYRAGDAIKVGLRAA